MEYDDALFYPDDANAEGELTWEQKVRALVYEGGYTRKEAIAMLEDMGEGE